MRSITNYGTSLNGIRALHLTEAILIAGLAALYVPTFWHLFQTIWKTDAHSHGPVVLTICFWLFCRKWREIQDIPNVPALGLSWTIFIVALFFYILGRSQEIAMFEVGSLIWVIASFLLMVKGYQAIRIAWFPLFFMAFMVPLPGIVIDAVTLPMQKAVSYVVEHLLFWLGYPVARSGVILHIGQFKLLVAEACAGLHTLFTLEALGLLYLNLKNYASVKRNATLSIFIVPISFAANVIRVLILTLITYHLGDAAGQGFLHGFSGIALFMSALLLIICIDLVIQKIINLRIEHTARTEAAV